MTIDSNSKTVQKYTKGSEDQERDPHQIENNPGMFAAEQTWPTEEEMKQAQKQRANSLEEAEEGMDTEMDSALAE